MSNVECAIKIMKERGDIKCHTYGLGSMPRLYTLASPSTEIASKFFQALEEDDSYLVCGTTIPCRSMEFIKKQEFEEWIENKCRGKETVNVPWENSHIDSILKRHVKNKYDMRKNKYINIMEITNLEEKAKREAKAKEKEQEAIDLLEKIL